MSVSYLQYREGRSNIKHPMGLVLGWVVSDFAAGLETRYALFENGKTCRGMQVDIWGKNRDAFDFSGQRWLVVDSVPDHAQFIGYYQPPRAIDSDVQPIAAIQPGTKSCTPILPFTSPS